MCRITDIVTRRCKACIVHAEVGIGAPILGALSMLAITSAQPGSPPLEDTPAPRADGLFYIYVADKYPARTTSTHFLRTRTELLRTRAELFPTRTEPILRNRTEHYANPKQSNDSNQSRANPIRWEEKQYQEMEV